MKIRNVIWGKLLDFGLSVKLSETNTSNYSQKNRLKTYSIQRFLTATFRITLVTVKYLDRITDCFP